MGFNGEVLISRGDAFASALTGFWDWELEVCRDQPLRDGWRLIEVRTPADEGELAALAAAAGEPVLACRGLDSDGAHVRGADATGGWEARLNPEHAAYSQAERIVADELGNGTMYPYATPEDYARADRLAERFLAEIAAERPAVAQAAAEWAERAGFVGVAARVGEIEEILAATWKPFAEHGFFALLVLLGLEDPDSEADVVG